MLRSEIYVAYPAPPVVRDLFELGLLYDKVFDGGGHLESTIESSQLFANFLENGQVENFREWEFEGLAVVLLDSVVLALRSRGVKEAVISKMFQYFGIIDELSPSQKRDRRLYLGVIGDLAEKLRANHPDIMQTVVTLFRDLPLLRGSLVEYSTLELRKTTRPVLADYLFEAMKLDEKDVQFRRIAHKVDKSNPPNWTAFHLNSSIMESSYLGMDLYLEDSYMPLLKYKLLRGASRDIEYRTRRLMQKSLSLLVPDIFGLDIPSFLEIRNSKDARLLRSELTRLVSSEKITEANTSEYLTQTYVRQLEEIARARKPNLAHWLLTTSFSLVHPVAGLLVSGLNGYKQIRDSFSDWKLALTTLKLRDKTQRKMVKTGKLR